MPHIRAGKFKAIGSVASRRSPQLPDVPTFAKSGLPGVESYGSYGFFAPAKTPKDMVAKINEAPSSS